MPFHRFRHLAVIVTAALLTAGCGAVGSEPGSAQSSVPSVDAPDRVGQVRSAAGRPARSLPGDVFDTTDPAIGELDPDLLAAVRDAAEDARGDGVRILVTSGWRSREHQQRLFDEAVAEHGGESEARRWVSTPDTSAHVTGDAVDIGPAEAYDWLRRYGAAYGLCQIFANEGWHFELATTPGGRCPEMLPDGSYRG